MQVDYPVHKIEAHEAHREHDPGVLVDVGGGDAVQLVDVLVGVDDVLGDGSGRLLVTAAVAAPAAVHRALQGAALAVRLWVVHFETHLLEQRFPLTSTLSLVI